MLLFANPSHSEQHTSKTVTAPSSECRSANTVTVNGKDFKLRVLDSSTIKSLFWDSKHQCSLFSDTLRLPGTHHLPASCSWMLRLQVQSITPGTWYPLGIFVSFIKMHIVCICERIERTSAFWQKGFKNLLHGFRSKWSFLNTAIPSIFRSLWVHLNRLVEDA